MSDPGETTKISFSDVSKSTVAKRKVGRPKKTVNNPPPVNKESESDVLRVKSKKLLDEYYLFVEANPQYKMGDPNIRTESDYNTWVSKIESVKRRHRLEESKQALPLNFFYLISGFTKYGQLAAIHLKNDKNLAKRLGLFKQKMIDEYDMLEPIIIKFIAKYPILQRGEVMVEIQLFYQISQIWASTSDEFIAFDANVSNNTFPVQFDGM